MQWPKDRLSKIAVAKRQVVENCSGQKTGCRKLQWPKDRLSKIAMAKKQAARKCSRATTGNFLMFLVYEHSNKFGERAYNTADLHRKQRNGTQRLGAHSASVLIYYVL